MTHHTTRNVAGEYFLAQRPPSGIAGWRKGWIANTGSEGTWDALMAASSVPERQTSGAVNRKLDRPAITCTALCALFFGVEVEKPLDRTLDLLQIRIRQASNHTLQFMMLYGLHALHIHVARLVQKLRLSDGHLILTVPGGGRNGSTDSKSSRSIIIAPGNNQHWPCLGCHAKVHQKNLSWFSRHTQNQARTVE